MSSLPEKSLLIGYFRTVVFNNLFGRLQGQIQGLFPSTRALANLPFGAGSYMASGSALRPDIDLQDQPIWSFLAAVAVCSDPEQQQALVMDAKDKVLECVTAASQKNTAPELAAMKIVRFEALFYGLKADLWLHRKTPTCYCTLWDWMPLKLSRVMAHE